MARTVRGSYCLPVTLYLVACLVATRVLGRVLALSALELLCPTACAVGAAPERSAVSQPSVLRSRRAVSARWWSRSWVAYGFTDT